MFFGITVLPSSTRDVCFASRVSPIIRVPGPTFSHLGLGSCVSCIISVPDIGSQIPPLDCQVLGPGSHPLVEFLVLSLGSHLQGPGSWVLGLIHKMGLVSHISDPTKSPGSWFPLFGYILHFSKYHFLLVNNMFCASEVRFNE